MSDDQFRLFFEQKLGRKPRRTLPPPVAPRPVARWRRVVRASWRKAKPAWVGLRWILKHGSEIRTAFWIGGGLLTVVLVGLGFAARQYELGPYRFRIEPKVVPPIEKGWEPKVRKENSGLVGKRYERD